MSSWYDAGKIETMLETTRRCLLAPRPSAQECGALDDHRPVYIEDDVTLKKSKVGPNVSIVPARFRRRGSHDTIIGSKAISKIVLKTHHRRCSDRRGSEGEMTVGDHSEVHAS